MQTQNMYVTPPPERGGLQSNTNYQQRVRFPGRPQASTNTFRPRNSFAGGNQHILSHLWDLGRTPIHVDELGVYLKQYPDQQVANELVMDFLRGLDCRPGVIKNVIVISCN